MSKYRFDITWQGQKRKLILKRSTGESEEHLVMKLLAYLLFFERPPKVEVRIWQHYKPDLVCTDGDKVTLWVDCGDIAIHKLDKISTGNRHAEVYVVKPTLRKALSYKQHADKRIKHPERVGYITFEDGFVDRVVASVCQANVLEAWFDDERSHIVLNLNGCLLQSRIIWVKGGV